MPHSHSYRDDVRSTQRLAALLVRPREVVGAVLKATRGAMYSKRGVRNIMDAFVDPSGQIHKDPDTDRAACKLLLMDPAQLAPEQVKTPLATATADKTAAAAATRFFLLPTELNALAELSVLPSTLLKRLQSATAAAPIELALGTYEVELTYANYTMRELLGMILPAAANAVALSGFEQVGHIAHVNLSSAHVPFKNAIGEVILDCNPTVDVVVNKTDAISSVFREFPMEIVARRSKDGAATTPLQRHEGEDETDYLLRAAVRQHGCVFHVPYNRVYWNSRLSHEHMRLVDAMHARDELFDVMAGVGPFAVPAARKGVRVYANDLNPAAAEYIKINAKLNHLPPDQVSVFAMDGRDFLKTVVYDHVMQRGAPASTYAFAGRRHVTMNLPAIAATFLDVFAPSSADSPWHRRPAGHGVIDKTVLFHVYCFSAAADLLADAVAQVEQHLGYLLDEKNKEHVVMVRDVAPTKRMVCVSFTLPDAFWAAQRAEDDERPAKISRKEL